MLSSLLLNTSLSQNRCIPSNLGLSALARYISLRHFPSLYCTEILFSSICLHTVTFGFLLCLLRCVNLLRTHELEASSAPLLLYP